MDNQNDIQNIEDEYSNLLESASPEFIDFIFSDETTKKITDICLKNNIDDGQKIAGVAFRMVWVLSGRLPKENLAFTFESGLKIPAENAKKIADEINQFIASAGIKPGTATIPQTEPEVKTEKPVAEELPKRPPSKDVYREKIE